MNEYIYIWGFPVAFPERKYGRYEKRNQLSYFRFLEGKLVSGSEVPKISFDSKVEYLRKFDLLPHSGRIPLVSDALASALKEKVGDDLQLVRASLDCKDGEIRDYFLLNIIKLVKIVDLEKSEFVPIPGSTSPMSYNRAVMRDGVSAEFFMARDVNEVALVFLTEEMKEIVSALCRDEQSFYLAEEFLT